MNASFDQLLQSLIDKEVNNFVRGQTQQIDDSEVTYFVVANSDELPRLTSNTSSVTEDIEIENLQEKLPHEEILIPRAELDELIEECLEREWGVSDDPDDLGGATAYGITHKVAKEYGYNVSEITPTIAKQIFEHKYYFQPKINFIPDKRLQWRLLLDGLNSGPVRIVKRLQEILNFQNNFGAYYPEITVDGYLGPQTFQTLRKAKKAFKKQYQYKTTNQKQLSEMFWQHLCLQMHALQYAWYHDIVKRKPEQEKWYRGWKNRIAFPPKFYTFDTGEH